MRNSDQSRKKSGQEKGENEASNRVVRGSKQVPMYEMRKKKQMHENARQMRRTKILVEKIGKMRKASSGRS